jgi:hypothetical protein
VFAPRCNSDAVEGMDASTTIETHENDTIRRVPTIATKCDSYVLRGIGTFGIVAAAAVNINPDGGGRGEGDVPSRALATPTRYALSNTTLFAVAT